MVSKRSDRGYGAICRVQNGENGSQGAKQRPNQPGREKQKCIHNVGHDPATHTPVDNICKTQFLVYARQENVPLTLHKDRYDGKNKLEIDISSLVSLSRETTIKIEISKSFS